ncbi:MAG: hypothetical protein FWE72_04400 [Spirochaetaceae bacterium]|nr:hypothetical protein [Spirochaetaceae bacterium]
MKKEDLKTMLIFYRNGVLPKKKIIEAISLFVYKFPLKKYRWKEDDCSEFFSYFFPKINKIIDSFKITEVPFEAYLIKTLKLQIKTFALKKTTAEINRKILKNKEFWPYDDNEDYCAEPGIEFFKKDIQPTYSFIKNIFSNDKVKHRNNNKTLKKRILLLILKNMNHIKETEIPAIAEILNCDKGWLYETFSKINKKIENKIKRKKLLEERRNKHFCRLYHFHELLSVSEIAEEKIKYSLVIAKIKLYITNITKKIDMITPEPTHKDIAEIMNIPKGSVDSSLFYFKIYLEQISGK